MRDLLRLQISVIFLWVVRASALVALFWVWSQPRPVFQLLFPPIREIQLDPPQQVETVDSRVCVHTRLTDEVEEVKIQRSLRLVREMGAGTIVEFFPWAYIENERGVYNWQHPDLRIKHAENQGLRVIARMGLVPQWAREGEKDHLTTFNYLPEEAFPDFARFVAAFAARYRGRVDHLIIWNEPNLNFEWGERPADPAAYTRLLKLAYDAAHKANPDVVILGGALAVTLEPPGGFGAGWNDIDYLEAMYQAGAKGAFDVLAVHNYGFNLPPQDVPAYDRLNFRRIELLREVMVRYGDAEKSIMITETGWNDDPHYTYHVTAEQRIAYTLEAFTFTRNAYPWLETLCIWQFRLPAPTNAYPDYFTFVSSEFDLKPIYYAVQALARGWEQPLWQ